MRSVGFLLVAVAAGCSSSTPPDLFETPNDGGAPTDIGTGDAQLSKDGSPVDSGGDPGNDGLTALQKHKAEMLTSIWENGTTVLQYPYCENIRDGRGYTSGRAGFCTGTGDAVLVVRCFDTRAGAANPLHKYLPELTALETTFNNTGKNQAKTSGLDALGSYCTDWSSSSNGAQAAAFQACQDGMVDKLYYTPAVDQAKKWGLSQALTIAALYDAEINQGEGGTAAIIKNTNNDVGNNAQTPASAKLTLVAESTWLDKFLQRRLAVLRADSTWSNSVDRDAEYQVLRSQANWDLSQPIVTDAKANKLFPNKGYKDSGYPNCTIAADGTVSGDAECTSPTGG